MSNPGGTSSASIKGRQYLLLAGIGVVIVGAAGIGVALTSGKKDTTPVTKLQTTNIVAPGAQVDPKDAWRGQADAQMKTIEQQSREINEKNGELSQQNKEMLERLKKLEQSGLTPLPPAPVAAPPLRPDFGPDLAAKETQNPVQGPQIMPPPPIKGTAPQMPPGRPTAPAFDSGSIQPPTRPAILTITLNDGNVAGAGSKASVDTKKLAKTVGNYLPSGSFTRAVLLGGLDAPTGGQSQKDPQPVVLRLTDNAVLPNRFRFQVKECFVVGAGYGDISSERAYVRTETLSCVTQSGRAIDIPIKGYVAGEDGKAGMRGRLVSKQGQLLANALTAGIASGIGHAFQQNATTYSVSPLGSTATVNQGAQLTAGIGSGVGGALDRLAQYYITLAEKVFPVIEVDAGRMVDVVVSQGALIEGMDANEDSGDGALPALRARERQLKRSTHEAD